MPFICRNSIIRPEVGKTFLHRYMITGYKTLTAAIISIPTAFLSIPHAYCYFIMRNIVFDPFFTSLKSEIIFMSV